MEKTQFVTIDILGTQPETPNWNSFVVVMTRRYAKMTCAVPVSKTIVLHAALTFIDSWVRPYGIPSFLQTYDRLQFVSKFINALCSF